MSTHATPPTPPTPQLPGGNVVSFIDSMDLLKYPMLAQMVTAMNQQGLNNVLSDLLMAIQKNEATTLATTIQSGFQGASAQTLYGGMEAAIGAVQAGAGAMNVKSSVDQGKDIMDAAQARSQGLSDIEQDRAKSSIVPARVEENPPQSQGHGVNVAPNGNAAPQPPADQPVDEEALKRRENTVEADYKAKMKGITANNAAASSRAEILKASGQLLQLPAQAAQGHSQVTQMQGTVSQSAYSAQDAVRQSANQTLQQVLQLDVYAQNVASSRA